MIAYVDESISEDWFLLGGFIATEVAWKAFEADWQFLLDSRMGITQPDGLRMFKWTEMNATAERRERIPIFLDAIAKHATGSVYVAFQPYAFRRALRRVQVIGLQIEKWGPLGNPYYMAIRALLDMFHLSRDKYAPAIPSREKVHFIFDRGQDAKTLLNAWDDYVTARPAGIRESYGDKPKFLDDETTLPLQAADLLVGSVRQLLDAGARNVAPVLKEAGNRHGRKYLHVRIELTEEDLISNIMKALRTDPQTSGKVIYCLPDLRNVAAAVKKT